MTAGQVSDLMGGRPGPVPMDIAQEAAALRMAGWTPDQIADVLGDKLQARYGMYCQFTFMLHEDSQCLSLSSVFSREHCYANMLSIITCTFKMIFSHSAACQTLLSSQETRCWHWQ